ncbi:MAG: hypothetical protein E7670_07450 [Ruminococcaceae bacterium]|nr:hypothetical protein [Oscillospiraceae bacterium]
MIRACQKKILFVAGAEHSAFETAYFVLRENSESLCLGGDDIIKEADRIINERLPAVKKKKQRLEKIKKVLLFTTSALSGALVGGGTVAIISFLF